LNTYPDFRQAFDKEVGIKLVKERTQERKHGVLFVNEDGNNDGNATLKDALQNQVFVEKYLENAEKKESLSKLSSMIYDITDDEDRSFLYSLNAYYNLFDMGSSDSLISSSRFDEPVTREEFYSAVYRAENKVSQSLKNNPGFDVELGGGTEHTKYTKKIAPYGFLQVENKSLDELTYHGVITRAEALYTLVQLHFAKEYKSADGELKAYEDTKNAGDLASILTIKDMERWQAYSLSYMVENPKKGMQEELYKAMVVAKNNDILSDDESRWSEALTKGDALSFIVNTYLSKNREGYVSTVEYGVIVEEKATVAKVEKTETETEEIITGPFDPDTIPKNGAITYREIRDGVEASYKALLRMGYSKEEAMEDSEIFAQQLGTTLEDLNNLQGYTDIGEERVVATAPSAPKPSTTTKPSTSNTPKPSTSNPSTPKPSQPKETISEHGYPITDWDKDGNGVKDSLEEYYKVDDGTSSLPVGAPNPVTMP